MTYYRTHLFFLREGARIASLHLVYGGGVEYLRSLEALHIYRLQEIQEGLGGLAARTILNMDAAEMAKPNTWLRDNFREILTEFCSGNNEGRVVLWDEASGQLYDWKITWAPKSAFTAEASVPEQIYGELGLRPLLPDELLRKLAA